MPRVVLDTNVVLSALVFKAGRLSWIRQGWQQNRLKPLVCKATVSELLRVLAYPKFRLSAQEQEDLLADFLPHAEVVELPPQWPDLPRCRDEKDQVFLVLAHVARADALVSGDVDLLSMRGSIPQPIFSVEEWAGTLE